MSNQKLPLSQKAYVLARGFARCYPYDLIDALVDAICETLEEQTADALLQQAYISACQMAGIPTTKSNLEYTINAGAIRRCEASLEAEAAILSRIAKTEEAALDELIVRVSKECGWWHDSFDLCSILPNVDTSVCRMAAQDGFGNIYQLLGETDEVKYTGLITTNLRITVDSDTLYRLLQPSATEYYDREDWEHRVIGDGLLNLAEEHRVKLTKCGNVAIVARDFVAPFVAEAVHTGADIDGIIAAITVETSVDTTDRFAEAAKVAAKELLLAAKEEKLCKELNKYADTEPNLYSPFSFAQLPLSGYADAYDVATDYYDEQQQHEIWVITDNDPKRNNYENSCPTSWDVTKEFIKATRPDEPWVIHGLDNKIGLYDMFKDDGCLIEHAVKPLDLSMGI